MRRHIFSERPLGRILAWALWIFPMGLFAQTTFYNTGQIQRIEIQFNQPNWDYRMDTAKARAEFAGDALDENLGVGSDENGHGRRS